MTAAPRAKIRWPSLAPLAAALAQRRCALFTGAGTTSTSGGAPWSELADELKTKFGYSSPLKDPFEIMGDLGRRVGQAAVYGAVQARLKDAKLLAPRNELSKMPWFVTFTTNFDTALEESLRQHQA